MTFVLTGSGIRCKYTHCVDVCAVPQWKTTLRIKAARPSANDCATVDNKRTELKC